jgi:hypothetical protein
MKIAKKESFTQKILKFKFSILISIFILALCIGFYPSVSAEFAAVTEENKTQQASIRKNKFIDGLPEGAYIIKNLGKDWYIVRFEEKEYLGKYLQGYNNCDSVILERMN